MIFENGFAAASEIQKGGMKMGENMENQDRQEITQENKTPKNKLKSSLWRVVLGIFAAQITIMALALFIQSMLLQFFEANASLWLGTSFTLLFWLGATYNETWHAGVRDQNLVKYGHITYNPYRGLTAGLLSQIPGLILALLVVFFRLFPNGATDIILVIYNVYHAPAMAFLNQFDQYLWSFFVPLVIPIAGATIGYLFGYRQISLRQMVMYSNPKPKKREKDRRFR